MNPVADIIANGITPERRAAVERMPDVYVVVRAMTDAWMKGDTVGLVVNVSQHHVWLRFPSGRVTGFRHTQLLRIVDPT